MRLVCILLLCVLMAACNGLGKEESSIPSEGPVIVSFTGKHLPAGSVKQPKRILLDSGKIIRKNLGPVVDEIFLEKATNFEFIRAVPSGRPLKFSLGESGCLLPEVLKFKFKIVPAGNPEVIEASEMRARDRNNSSFSFFGKVNGLKNPKIRCIAEDKLRNLWFGSQGGGITRYDGRFFTFYNQKLGIPNDVINCIHIDRNGNLWFGTGAGLVSFDGKNFSILEGNGTTLEQEVYVIKEDSKGTLWFGTSDGVLNFDGKKLIRFAEGQGLSSNIVNTIIEDHKGNIWFGSEDGILSKFDGKNFERFQSISSLNYGSVLSLMEDEKGGIWIGLTYGLIYFDLQNFHIFSNPAGLSDYMVRRIVKDQSGSIWFGTDNGCCVLDGKKVRVLNEEDGLCSNFVYDIFQDDAKNIWIGTAKGAAKYGGRAFRHYNLDFGNGNTPVNRIFEESPGKLWFASENGITKFDGKNFNVIDKASGLPSQEVQTIIKGRGGDIWLGTRAGAVHFDGKVFSTISDACGLENEFINAIIQDQKGNFWFGTNEGGIVNFDGKFLTQYLKEQGLSSNSIHTVFEDRSGKIWLGTNGGGVTFLKDGQFTHIGTKDGLPSDVVLSIAEDKFGNIWFGTLGGVVRFDGKQLIIFSEKDGLSNESVFSLLFDRSGNLWIGTRFGINQISAKTIKVINDFFAKQKKFPDDFMIFKSYSYGDGFLSIGCNRNAIFESSDGKIWLGGNDRLTEINPAALQSDRIAPKVQLIGIDLFNEKISWKNLKGLADSAFALSTGIKIHDIRFEGISSWYNFPQKLDLPFDNNNLTFRFIGITTNRPERVRYSVKLEGLDQSWGPLTERSEITYNNLKSGSYILKVKARNSEGIWGNELSYAFSIRPPWWNTWWAYSIYLIVGFSGLNFYISRREKILRDQQKELEVGISKATQEIREKKDFAEKQKEIIQKQKELTEIQKNIIEEKHRELLDSISYARRIQNVILPSQRVFSSLLRDVFVIYLPKDIVAGDFYWINGLPDGRVLFAVCDCTGHGVPGAMVSVVCSNALNKAVNEFGLTEPAQILDKVSDLVRKDLSSFDEEDLMERDGMDISLCLLDSQNSFIEWAGANNPLWIVRNVNGSRELIELKPDKMAIGSFASGKNFQNHVLTIQPGDVLYLFSDGYYDQFGGSMGKKLTKKGLRELLLTCSAETIENQQAFLMEEHLKWKGSGIQVDDICLVGLRI
jgi:ligand-binding sensor domain-containing protein/serine phosphatase RsbU (regulator of sigma subunit)